VEVLSIAVISSYIVSLALGATEPAKSARRLTLEPEIAARALTPLVVCAEWRGTRRIHRTRASTPP
jgi:uncharacterized membrane-anchored protein